MKLTTTQLKEIREGCRTIPDDDGWWNKDNKEKFVSVAAEMVEAGMAIERVIDLLAIVHLGS